MKYILTLLFISCFTSFCFGQDVRVTPEREDAFPNIECTVHWVEDAKKVAKSDDDKISEGVEVGKFSPLPPIEGSNTVKRFRLGRSNLFAFAYIHYDDDMSIGDDLLEAMLMSIGVTASRSREPRSWIAESTMQVEYKRDFRAANVALTISRGLKSSQVLLNCGTKK